MWALTSNLFFSCLLCLQCHVSVTSNISQQSDIFEPSSVQTLLMFDAFMLCTAQLSAFLRQGRSLACVRSRPSFLSIRTTNINRLNLNQSSWADRLPTICSLLIVKGGRKVRDSECFDSVGERVQLLWTGTRLPGSIVQQRKLSMLAEFTCESFNRTVLPFTLEAKGTEPPVTSSCAKISVSLNSHNVQIEDLSGLSTPTQITIL